jgi:serine/threonine-protein kinase HipA
MMTHEDEVNQQVSLWLPRFDIFETDGVATRLGMESIYSILNAGPGSFQDHFYVINTVWRKIRNTTTMSQE